MTLCKWEHAALLAHIWTDQEAVNGEELKLGYQFQNPSLV